MDQFLINISSFPVSVYTVALGVVLGYWFVALIGVFELDFLSTDVDVEVGELGTVAGLLTTLGLKGVPITIVISLLALNAWFVCYFLSKLVPAFPDLFSLVEVLINLAVIVLSFMLSLILSAAMIRPLRGMFKAVNNVPISISVIGKSCRVRSSKVDQQFGEVECIHQGASLILKVRSYPGITFNTGDKVVLIDYFPNDEVYFVVSEKEFNKEKISGI